MNARHSSIAVLVVLMIGSAAGMGAVISKDIAGLKELDSSIREQEKIKQEAREERKQLREKLEQAVKAIKETPDSLSGSRSGRVLDTSFTMGKQETIVDQKEMRADKRLAFKREQREQLKNRLIRWVGGLGAVEIVLAVCVVVLARRSAGRRAARTP